MNKKLIFSLLWSAVVALLSGGLPSAVAIVVPHLPAAAATVLSALVAVAALHAPSPSKSSPSTVVIAGDVKVPPADGSTSA